MAGFALSAFGVAVFNGRQLERKGRSSDLVVKLRILYGIVAVQTLLTLCSYSRCRRRS